jgi:hypothetical protein
MANPRFYRQEAKMARERAAVSSDPIATQTWIRIAEEYEKLAASMDTTDRSLSYRLPPQPQPMQQQQSKAKPKDDK